MTKTTWIDGQPDSPRFVQITNPAKLRVYEKLVERDGDACQWCGVEPPSGLMLTIDHVDPKGGEALGNKQLLCSACNASKGDRPNETKTVQWLSALWQHGFTMIPNVVVRQDALDAYAHRVYTLLLHYARQDESCWPGQAGLAKLAGCSDKRVRQAIRDLTDAALVRVRRRGRGETNVYLLLTPRPDENDRSRTGERSDQERTHGPPNKTQGKKTQKEDSPNGEPSPRLTQIDERDVALDVLARECGIAAGSPRAELCAVALYGKGKQRGIRSMFFQEIEAGLDPETRTVTAAFGSEDFERDLAAAIKRKAAAYRARLPGAECSPTALAKWWLDLAVPSPGTSRMIDCPEDGCSSVARSELDLSEHLETWHDYSEATARSVAAKAAA